MKKLGYGGGTLKRYYDHDDNRVDNDNDAWEGSVEKEMKVKAWDGSSGGGEGLRQMERIANTTTADTLMGAVMMIRIKMVTIMVMVDESLWLYQEDTEARPVLVSSCRLFE